MIHSMPVIPLTMVASDAGNSTLTDAHSFAVIAFQMLSLVHPLIGDLVRDGEPEVEQEAYEGRLPWVDHPIEDRNRASDGIPRDIALSPKLKALCDRSFGAGLADPGERPRIPEWLEALDSARNFTAKCDSCSSTYYARSPRCPFCDSAAPRFLTAVLRMWSTEMELSDSVRFDRWRAGAPASRYVVTETEETTLLASTIGVPGAADVKITFEERGVGVSASGPNRYWMEQPGSTVVLELGTRKRTLPVGLSPSILLHFGSREVEHLVAQFELPLRSQS
jgi:hypothetical protein